MSAPGQSAAGPRSVLWGPGGADFPPSTLDESGADQAYLAAEGQVAGRLDGGTFAPIQNAIDASRRDLVALSDFTPRLHFPPGLRTCLRAAEPALTLGHVPRPSRFSR